MKKKLKDVTVVEIHDECKKHNECAECPFAKIKCCKIGLESYNNLDQYILLSENEQDEMQEKIVTSSFDDDKEMSFERAIYQITNYGLDDPDSPKELAEATEKWREACLKQIQKKPKMDEYAELCPVCGNLLCMVIDEPQKYCDECGQRIDWGNDDANE